MCMVVPGRRSRRPQPQHPAHAAARRPLGFHWQRSVGGGRSLQGSRILPTPPQSPGAVAGAGGAALEGWGGGSFRGWSEVRGGGGRCSGSAGPWCVFVNMHAFCHRAAQTRVSVSGSASVCHAAAIWLCMPTCVGASPSVTGTRSDLLVGTRHAPQRRAQQSLAFARLPVLTLAQSLALALRRPAVATHRPAESTEGADRPSHREPLRSTGRLR